MTRIFSIVLNVKKVSKSYEHKYGRVNIKDREKEKEWKGKRLVKKLWHILT